MPILWAWQDLHCPCRCYVKAYTPVASLRKLRPLNKPIPRQWEARLGMPIPGQGQGEHAMRPMWSAIMAKVCVQCSLYTPLSFPQPWQNKDLPTLCTRPAPMERREWFEARFLWICPKLGPNAFQLPLMGSPQFFIIFGLFLLIFLIFPYFSLFFGLKNS